jgi:hypothetical protein
MLKEKIFLCYYHIQQKNVMKERFSLHFVKKRSEWKGGADREFPFDPRHGGQVGGFIIRTHRDNSLHETFYRDLQKSEGGETCFLKRSAPRQMRRAASRRC